MSDWSEIISRCNLPFRPRCSTLHLRRGSRLAQQCCRVYLLLLPPKAGNQVAPPTGPLSTAPALGHLEHGLAIDESGNADFAAPQIGVDFVVDDKPAAAH